MYKLNEDSDRVLTWLPPEDIEDEAKEQLSRLSRLPFIFKHVAVMSDCHVGKGSTIGSVIVTKGAIIPAAVGVDIGCVDKDTEFLSPTGWKKISEYNSEKIMQYNPSTGHADFISPANYVKRPSEGFYHFYTKYGIDQMLSKDHRMLVFEIKGRDRHRELAIRTAKFVATEHDRLVLGYKGEIETTFNPQLESSLKLTDNELRLMVAIIADGTYGRTGDRAYIKIIKERKIERLKYILELNNIEYKITQYQNEDDHTVHSFAFYAPMREKSYKPFWQASAEQLKIITDECVHWDGSKELRAFFTKDKESADFMQYAFSASGYRGVLITDIRKDGELEYRVFYHPNTKIGFSGAPKTPVKFVESVDGFEYCFTTQTGFWVMRRNRNVAITGNCGMDAVLTTLTAKDLPDNLKDMRLGIERRIPLGAGGRNQKMTETAIIRAKLLLDAAGDTGSDYEKDAKNWAQQLGSLGSGNHFIEVCLDETERVWLVLHSGSRGVGNRVASRHIKVAQELMDRMLITLEDKDLAYLPEGTNEFKDYITDLLWCQEYAFLNRKEMMDRCMKELSYAIYKEDGHQSVLEKERISCHHNFAQREHHFKQNVWVTRKGAIQMREGQRGIIPGSMGTRTYIVSGLGERMSFNSAPHGAGRRMSRKKAREQFTLADLIEATKGVECRHDAALIDEIPGAYKDIQQVIDRSSDLVKVDHVLKQILNIKGD